MKIPHPLSSLPALGLWVLLQGCTQKPQRFELHRVEISQMQFQPAILKLHKGDTVVFINHDMVEHNITDAANQAWKPATLPTGRSWRLVPERSTGYYCSIHPVMKGRLVVE